MFCQSVWVIFFVYSASGVILPDPCLFPKLMKYVENRGTNCIASTSPLICDRNGFEPGWYTAVLNSEYLTIPNKPPKPFACGTESPIWIDGNHPETEGNISTVNGCVREFKEDDTCTFSFPIQVIKCRGFYVYNLTYVDLCYRGFCFGNHSCTKSMSTTTSGHSIETTTISSLPPSDPCMHAVNLPFMKKRGTQCAAEIEDLLCDRTLQPKWYKAIDDNHFHDMPASCVNVASCGTEEPIWLNDSLPSFADGAVVRQACVRGLSPEECCKSTIDIIIRNCFTYNVYYLPYTDFCYQAYCFGNRKCVTEQEVHSIVKIEKKSDTLLYSLLGSFFGLVCVAVGIGLGVFVVKAKRVRVGNSMVDFKNVAPPPYSPPGTNVQINACDVKAIDLNY